MVGQALPEVRSATQVHTELRLEMTLGFNGSPVCGLQGEACGSTSTGRTVPRGILPVHSASSSCPYARQQAKSRLEGRVTTSLHHSDFWVSAKEEVVAFPGSLCHWLALNQVFFPTAG